MLRTPPRVRLLAGVLLLLALPAAAAEPRKIKVRFPAFTLEPGVSRELCVLVRVPVATAFDLASWEVHHRGVRTDFGPAHFLVYLYQGEHGDAFPTRPSTPVASRGCLDLGPADRDRRQLIASSVLVDQKRTLPPRIALRLDPVPATPGGPPASIALVLAGDWTNRGTRTRRAATKVVLRRVKKRETRRPVVPLVDRAAEQALTVAPGEVRSTEESSGTPGDRWRPEIEGGAAGDACVLYLTGHMHKRGRFFGLDLVDANGTVVPPPETGGVANPFVPGRIHRFGALDYTDPGLLDLTSAPLLVRQGQALRYACWHDNGVTTLVRLGCEQTPDVPPGIPIGLPGGGPAKPCTVAGAGSPQCPAIDPAHPGRSFTGRCVPANLVAGPTVEDEACVLIGAWFDADPSAPSGEECRVR
jgi:hypothetical protein